MSRYNPRIAHAVPSQEGFFSNVGKFLSDVGSSISRANAISLIDFSGEARPEVIGVPVKDYTQLLAKIKNAVASEQPWDVTVVTNHHESYTTGEVQSNGLPVRNYITLTSVVVMFGSGRNIIVRLPGYRSGEGMGSARVARLLIEDLDLKRME